MAEKTGLRTTALRIPPGNFSGISPKKSSGKEFLDEFMETFVEETLKDFIEHFLMKFLE